LITNASLGGIQGAFTRSTNFVGATTWIATPFQFTGSVVCTTLHTDDQLAVANAAQWTLRHQSENNAATVAPPVRKLLFVRAGRQWQMTIPINLGAATYSDLQISFRNNATSGGNFTGTGTGTIPVILFSGGLTGTVNLVVTFAKQGRYMLAISARDGSSNWSMFEIECLVVP
jgi:hypothetical protein